MFISKVCQAVSLYQGSEPEFCGLIELVMQRVCSCAAPLHLLRMGLFPCAPIRPTLAVDLNMLEYVNELFVRAPPNITAWCETLESFLGTRRYKVSTKVSLISINVW